MKAIIDRDQLILAMQTITGVIGSRTTLPILSSLKLRAVGDRLEFAATDLDLTLSTAAAARVDEPGEICVPAKRFSQFISALSDGEVELEGDKKNNLTVVKGSSRARMSGLDAKEFPPVATQIKEGKYLKIERAKLARVLALTSFAISSDESRFALNGLHFKAHKGRLTIEATDGRRLARCLEDCDQSLAFDLIIPTKAVNELARLVKAGEGGEIEMGWNDNQVSFSGDNASGAHTLLVSKRIEANYPNSDQVIPDKFEETVQVSREELIAAVRRAELMTTEKQTAVVLDLTVNNLEVRTDETPAGQARDTISLRHGGQPIRIAFNPGYLLDVLEAISTEEVTLHLIEAVSPGMITGDPGFLYIIMPMRTAESDSDKNARADAHAAAPAESTPAAAPVAEAKPNKTPKTPKAKANANQPEPEPAGVPA